VEELIAFGFVDVFCLSLKMYYVFVEDVLCLKCKHFVIGRSRFNSFCKIQFNSCYCFYSLKVKFGLQLRVRNVSVKAIRSEPLGAGRLVVPVRRHSRQVMKPYKSFICSHFNANVLLFIKNKRFYLKKTANVQNPAVNIRLSI